MARSIFLVAALAAAGILRAPHEASFDVQGRPSPAVPPEPLTLALAPRHPGACFPFPVLGTSHSGYSTRPSPEVQGEIRRAARAKRLRRQSRAQGSTMKREAR